MPSVVIDENGALESALALLSEADFEKVSIPPFELISQSIFENQRGKLNAHEQSQKIFDGCSQLDCTWLPRQMINLLMNSMTRLLVFVFICS